MGKDPKSFLNKKRLSGLYQGLLTAAKFGYRPLTNSEKSFLETPGSTIKTQMTRFSLGRRMGNVPNGFLNKKGSVAIQRTSLQSQSSATFPWPIQEKDSSKLLGKPLKPKWRGYP